MEVAIVISLFFLIVMYIRVKRLFEQGKKDFCPSGIDWMVVVCYCSDVM